MTDGNDLINPQGIAVDPNGNVFLGENYSAQIGLTKREHFAAMAMQGLLSNAFYSEGIMKSIKPEEQSEFLSVVAVEQADALIEALNKK